MGMHGAQYFLGVMYRDGQGVPKNYKTAVKWFRLAAKQGHADAQTSLGVMYQDGKGVPKNDKTAVKWYKLAAEQGDADAQNNLDRLEKRIAKEKTPPPSKSAAEKENAKLRRLPLSIRPNQTLS